MKSAFIFAGLSALYGVEATTNRTTIVCPNCPSPLSTNDIVTRKAIPTTSCDSPKLTVVPDMTTSVVKETKVYTITSCPPTVSKCPVGQKTTEIMSYTTVYPASLGSGLRISSLGGMQTSDVATGLGNMLSPGSSMTPTGITPVIAGASNMGCSFGMAMGFVAGAMYLV